MKLNEARLGFVCLLGIATGCLTFCDAVAQAQTSSASIINAAKERKSAHQKVVTALRLVGQKVLKDAVIVRVKRDGNGGVIVSFSKPLSGKTAPAGDEMTKLLVQVTFSGANVIVSPASFFTDENTKQVKVGAVEAAIMAVSYAFDKRIKDEDEYKIEYSASGNSNFFMLSPVPYYVDDYVFVEVDETNGMLQIKKANVGTLISELPR